MKKTAADLVQGTAYILLEKRRGPDNKIEYLGVYKGPVVSVSVDAKRKIATVQFQGGGAPERFDGQADFLSVSDYEKIKGLYPPEQGQELPVVRPIPGKLEKGPLVPRDIEFRSADNPVSELSDDSLQRKKPHPVRRNPLSPEQPPVGIDEPVVRTRAKTLRRSEPNRSQKRSEGPTGEKGKPKAKYNRRSGSYCRPRTRRCAATGQCVPVVPKPPGQKRCPRGSGQRRCADQVCYPVAE